MYELNSIAAGIMHAMIISNSRKTINDLKREVPSVYDLAEEMVAEAKRRDKQRYSEDDE